jgi:hypothetical protein
VEVNVSYTFQPLYAYGKSTWYWKEGWMGLKSSLNAVLEIKVSASVQE